MSTVPRHIWKLLSFYFQAIHYFLKAQFIHASVHEDLESHFFPWYVFLCYQGMSLLNAQTVWHTLSVALRDLLCVTNKLINSFAIHSLNLNTENVDVILIILIIYKWKVFFVEIILSFPFQASEDTDNFHYSHLNSLNVASMLTVSH